MLFIFSPKTMKNTYLITIILVITIILSQFAVSKTIEVKEGDLVKLNLVTYDEDGDELTYTFSEPLDENGEWQTDIGDYGEYDILITVSDGKSETTETLRLVVQKVNRAPVLQEFEDMVIQEGDTVEIEPSVTDEENDPLNIKISEPVGDDGEWETSYEDAGEYEILVTASDETHTVSRSFIITVEDVNRDPQINDYYPADDVVKIEEGEKEKFGVEAEDYDNDEISIQWYADGEQVSTGNEYTYKTDYKSAGEHKVKVEVSDKEITLLREWKVSVENVNRKPELAKLDDLAVNETEKVTLEVQANDPDGDELYYKVSDPVGNDLEWQTGYEDAGEYEVEIAVTDGELTDEQTIDLQVKDVDRAPLFQKIEDITINEEEKVTITLNAEDPDRDEVTFSATGMPEGAMLIRDQFVYESDYQTVYKPDNKINQVLGFLRLSDLYYGKSKTFDIQFTAHGKEKSTTQTVKLTVNDVNRDPYIEPIEDIIVEETEVVSLSPPIGDPDNDHLTYAFSEPLEKGEWKTGYNDSGRYVITAYANDGDATVSREFNLIINNKNRIPEFKEIEGLKTKENEEIKVSPEIFDPDGDIIELAIEQGPEGASISDGVFTWTPSYELLENGTTTVPVTFSANDGQDTVQYSTTIEVEDKNRLPRLLNVSEKTKAYVNDPIYFFAEPYDEDMDELSFRWKFGVMDWVQGPPVLKRTYTEPGDKTVKLIISDGQDSLTYEWDVKIYERPIHPTIGNKLQFEIDNQYVEDSELSFAVE